MTARTAFGVENAFVPSESECNLVRYILVAADIRCYCLLYSLSCPWLVADIRY
jgi:hypothetical protein